MVPRPRASFKLTHVVVIGTCVEISDNINAGSNGDSSVDKRGTGGDAQILVVKVDPPENEQTDKRKEVKGTRSGKATKCG